MHGGDIYSLSEELGWPERKIIDFSASINPLGVSKKVKAEIRRYLKYLHNYPDPDCRRLIRHLSKSVELPAECLLPGNGSTEIIYLIPRVLKPKRVLIPSPTFSEYERAIHCSGLDVEITYLNLKEEDGFHIHPAEIQKGLGGIDLIYLCNPNNPTATIVPKNELLNLARECMKRKTYLVVDEAFIDFVPEQTIIKEVTENPYLLVLRSLTKFYALTGLRIGYLAAHPDVIKRFKQIKEPWTVNTLAQRAAVVAIKDKAYIKNTFKLLEAEKRFLEKEFSRMDLFLYPSMVNFYLIKHPQSANIVNELRKQGILVRDCSNFRGLSNEFMRIAVKNHRDNTRLIKSLKLLLS